VNSFSISASCVLNRYSAAVLLAGISGALQNPEIASSFTCFKFASFQANSQVIKFCFVLWLLNGRSIQQQRSSGSTLGVDVVKHHIHDVYAYFEDIVFAVRACVSVDAYIYTLYMQRILKSQASLHL